MSGVDYSQYAHIVQRELAARAARGDYSAMHQLGEIARKEEEARKHQDDYYNSSAC